MADKAGVLWVRRVRNTRSPAGAGGRHEGVRSLACGSLQPFLNAFAGDAFESSSPGRGSGSRSRSDSPSVTLRECMCGCCNYLRTNCLRYPKLEGVPVIFQERL